MKKIFVAIRQGDIQTVKELLGKKPSLISCTAKQPPKKDDGQSPLQVAIKSSNFTIAEYLISIGADVNFIEQSDVNEWHAPVLHDCIRAALFPPRIIKDVSVLTERIVFYVYCWIKAQTPMHSILMKTIA